MCSSLRLLLLATCRITIALVKPLACRVHKWVRAVCGGGCLVLSSFVLCASWRVCKTRPHWLDLDANRMSSNFRHILVLYLRVEYGTVEYCTSQFHTYTYAQDADILWYNWITAAMFRMFQISARRQRRGVILHMANELHHHQAVSLRLYSTCSSFYSSLDAVFTDEDN